MLNRLITTLRKRGAQGRSFPVQASEATQAAELIAQVVAQRDALPEALRRELNELPRFSFLLDSKGNVVRRQDRTGRWIEWQAAHLPKTFWPFWTLPAPAASATALASKAGAAGAAMSTFPLVNVHSQGSAGKLALGFWDHWVGAVANEIAQAADPDQFAMVVLGSKGRTGLRDLLIGLEH